jgi:hypothetical protein
MSTEIQKQTASDDVMVRVRELASATITPELVKFNSLLEHKPREEWIKQQDGIPYLPIRVVEDLLTSFYGDWSVEFAEGGSPRIVGNSVCCSVVLRVVNPISGVARSIAGSGAVPIQLSRTVIDKAGNYVSGKRHNLDFENINVKAIQLGAPAALSFAISNAAKKIGRIFGANLNQEADFYLGVQNVYEAKTKLAITTLQQADDEILRLLDLYQGDDKFILSSQFEQAKADGDWNLKTAMSNISRLTKMIYED